MFQFTTRDVLWLTTFAAPGAAWFSDHREFEARQARSESLVADIRDHAERPRFSLQNAKVNNDRGVYAIEGRPTCDGCGDGREAKVEWQLIEQPIP